MHQARSAGRAGRLPTEHDVRAWHSASLTGIHISEPMAAGGFRGEGPPGLRLANATVQVGNVHGHPPRAVRRSVCAFFERLDTEASALQIKISALGVPVQQLPDPMYDEVLMLLAWVHGEWIRIHPFVNAGP